MAASLGCPTGFAAESKRVILLHSFGRDFKPWSDYATAIRAELDEYGIRVTTVSPGLMRTGSPGHALFKGQHDAEYTLFRTAASLPGLTISAERAARKIIEACRYGDPALTITPQAKLAAMMNAAAPGVTARAAMLVSRLLPRPNSVDGNASRKGLDVDHGGPSLVTALGDRAAVANNET